MSKGHTPKKPETIKPGPNRRSDEGRIQKGDNSGPMRPKTTTARPTTRQKDGD